jgi:hypothetical protein
MFEAELYPKQWRAIRQEKLERAGYRCEQCGVKHLDIQQGHKGTPYMVYLSIAHKNQYETWKKDAETLVLCQRCHRRYDRQFRRKAGRRYLTPVGYARLSVGQGKSKMLVGMARTFDELRDMVLTLPDSEFEVHLVMNLAIVGNGVYRKVDDQVRVLREYGACQGLPL